MSARSSSQRIHGAAPIAVSRYFALYLAQAGWLALGWFLFSQAYWPSECRPDSAVEIFTCSGHLADGRGWIETALMTWLWSTPLLIGLEVSRRFNAFRAER